MQSPIPRISTCLCSLFSSYASHSPSQSISSNLLLLASLRIHSTTYIPTYISIPHIGRRTGTSVSAMLVETLPTHSQQSTLYDIDRSLTWPALAEAALRWVFVIAVRQSTFPSTSSGSCAIRHSPIRVKADSSQRIYPTFHFTLTHYHP